MSAEPNTSKLSQLWVELRRRNVVRFTFGYAAASFIALQLAEIVFPAFGVGETGLRLLVVAVALGFVPAVALAWIYDITLKGIRRTEEDPTRGPRLHRLVIASFGAVTVLVAASVTWYVVEHDFFGGTAGMEARAAGYDPDEPIRALAVLPFANFSPDSDQDYLAAGLHEELIARLSMLEGVRVVSRTSVMRFAATTASMPEIGRELGVDVVIEGSVARSGDRVRITLQIIHAPSDSHIETLQFDRELGDIFALETEVAHAVVHEIRGTHEESDFARTASGVDPAAQEAYLRGRLAYERGTSEGARTALAYFEDAVDADPDFARAIAGLAGARFLVGLDDAEAGEAALEQARGEALAALALDTTSIEVREVLALIEGSLRQALADASATPPPESIPSVPDSVWIPAMTSLGRPIEDRIRRGSAPEVRRSAQSEVLRARSLLAAGRGRDAALEIERAIELAPTNATAWELLPRAYVAAGDPAAALDAARRWQLASVPGAPSPADVARLVGAVEAEETTGYWRWQLERLEAREARGESVPRVELAAAHAALGHREEAIELVRAAVDRHERGLVTLATDRVWDGLRGEPLFQQLESQAQALRLGLPR